MVKEKKDSFQDRTFACVIFFSKMKILIKTISGEDRTFDVEKSTTILSIKQQLYKLEGLLVEYQSIILPRSKKDQFTNDFKDHSWQNIHKIKNPL